MKNFLGQELALCYVWFRGSLYLIECIKNVATDAINFNNFEEIS